MKNILPILSSTAHKGQNGRLSIIGGCLEYTGAPFYSSISQLKGGADLAHIFCTRQAAIPIKAYSPEVITHPYLTSYNEEENPEKLSLEEVRERLAKPVRMIGEWQAAMHSFVIGPGLGRDKWIEKYLGDILEQFSKDQIIVLDADGLWYLVNEASTITMVEGESGRRKIFENVIMRNPSSHVLTPNQVEFERLWKAFVPEKQLTERETRFLAIEEFLSSLKLAEEVGVLNYFEITDLTHPIVRETVELSKTLNNVNILHKGMVDVITNGITAYIVADQSAKKRCGGVGDILSGLTGLYAYWGQKAGQNASNQEEKAKSILLGCVLGSSVTRKASKIAFQKHALSLTAPNVIESLGSTFRAIYNNYPPSEAKL